MIIQYMVVTASSASTLTHKIQLRLEEGWMLSGSHQVVVKGSKADGITVVTTENTLEYSQTIVKR